VFKVLHCVKTCYLSIYHIVCSISKKCYYCSCWMWLCKVYKSVLMSNGEFDSIIAFYNRIFMQSLKTFVMQFANTRTTVTVSVSHLPITSDVTSTGTYLWHLIITASTQVLRYGTCFYSEASMQSTVLATAIPSVCLPVCLSHAGTLSRRMKIGSQTL